MSEKLKLELNKKTQIFKNKQGVNFCGYKINEYRLKIRDKGKQQQHFFPLRTLIQIWDYVFQGIHTVKVLVLKRFIPS